MRCRSAARTMTPNSCDATGTPSSGSRRACSATASLRVTRRLAVVASGGTYPFDPLQGLPAGRFASIGLRLTGLGSGPTDEFARETREVARDRLVRDGIGALGVRRDELGGVSGLVSLR